MFAGDQKSIQDTWRRLMYGAEYASAGVDAAGRTKLLATTEELADNLEAAQALVLVCCDSMPLENKVVDTLFSNAGDELKRVVLVSRMGISRAKPPGLFGMGGEDHALKGLEAYLREAASSNGADLSIVRVGTLKGGGPGRDENTDEAELGLSKAYYNTLVDLQTFMTTSAMDKFTLGAKISKGDPFDISNPLIQAARASDFAPQDDETSRIVAAGAVVHALSHPSAVEISVSSAKGADPPGPPTSEQWAELFCAL